MTEQETMEPSHSLESVLDPSISSLTTRINLVKDGEHVFLKPGVYLGNSLQVISKHVAIEGLDSDNSKTQIFLSDLKLLVGCSFKNVSLYCNQQICAVSGNHTISNCRLLFEY